MSNLAAKQVDYLPTEYDLRQKLGAMFPDVFIKDYAAIKTNSSGIVAQVDQNTASIVTINGQIVVINGQITVINGQIVVLDARITTAEGEIVDLRNDLNDHIEDRTTHGALGNIVGDLNYPIINPDPSLSVAGVVFTALTVDNVLPSSASAPSSLGSAGAIYDQAYAQGQTDRINSLISTANQIITDYNNAVIQINLLMENMRIAKQLEELP